MWTERIHGVTSIYSGNYIKTPMCHLTFWTTFRWIGTFSINTIFFLHGSHIVQSSGLESGLHSYALINAVSFKFRHLRSTKWVCARAWVGYVIIDIQTSTRDWNHRIFRLLPEVAISLNLLHKTSSTSCDYFLKCYKVVAMLIMVLDQSRSSVARLEAEEPNATPWATPLTVTHRGTHPQTS